MVEKAVIESVRGYLGKLRLEGLEPRFAVLFGSHLTGRTDDWSDIDLIVVSPLFDSLASRDLVHKLWRLAARTDARIEPIPCGENNGKRTRELRSSKSPGARAFVSKND